MNYHRQPKLNVIIASLENNSDVMPVIVYGNDIGRIGSGEYMTVSPPITINSPNKYDIELFVAPKKGLFTDLDLNTFMEMLIPDGLEPDYYCPFRYSKGDLHLGRIEFSEVVGTEEIFRKVNTNYMRIANIDARAIEFNNEEENISKVHDLVSRISINLYPCKELVKDVWRDLNDIHNGKVSTILKYTNDSSRFCKHSRLYGDNRIDVIPYQVLESYK